MPRKPRQQSSTGYYHLTNRGVNKARVFLDGRDHEFFIECIEHAKRVCDFDVLAYCIMTTHYHIVIRCDGAVPISLFQSIGARFASYYHSRYRCAGQVFQGRFRSEAIENERHLLSAIRYVWRNPVKAHMCGCPSAYPWSSYNMLGKKGGLVDDDLLCGLMPESEWRAFTLQENDDRHLEPFPLRIADDSVRSMLGDTIQRLKHAGLESLDAATLRPIISRCVRAGASVRQIMKVCSITGVTLYRAVAQWPECRQEACSVVAMESP